MAAAGHAPCPPTRLLATCSADQTCKIWRTSNFSLMTELSIKSGNPGESSRGWMWGCAFSGDSQYIVTGEPRPGLPHPWPPPSLASRRWPPEPAHLGCSFPSAGTACLACTCALSPAQSPPPASSDNLARLWCVETGEIKREYGGHQKAVVCLAFNDSVLG